LHAEIRGSSVERVSSVYTFISFLVSGILTRIRLLGGDRSQVKVLEKQAIIYIRKHRFLEGLMWQEVDRTMLGLDAEMQFCP
jgi:hypothetical protein